MSRQSSEAEMFSDDELADIKYSRVALLLYVRRMLLAGSQPVDG